jgi:hypothetical protein
VQVIEASSLSQLDAALAWLRHVAAILAHADPFLYDHLQQLIVVGIEILIQACLSLDRAEQCAEQINEDGGQACASIPY